MWYVQYSMWGECMIGMYVLWLLFWLYFKVPYMGISQIIRGGKFLWYDELNCNLLEKFHG